MSWRLSRYKALYKLPSLALISHCSERAYRLDVLQSVAFCLMASRLTLHHAKHFAELR